MQMFFYRATALAAVVSLFGFAQSGEAQPLAAGQSRSVAIACYDFGFAPARFEARPGEMLTVTLVNMGRLPHNVAFVLPTGFAGLRGPVMSGQGASFRMQVPEERGTYVFFCPIGNHAQLGMFGRMEVRDREEESEYAPPPPPPAPRSSPIAP